MSPESSCRSFQRSIILPRNFGREELRRCISHKMGENIFQANLIYGYWNPLSVAIVSLQRVLQQRLFDLSKDLSMVL